MRYGKREARKLIADMQDFNTAIIRASSNIRSYTDNDADGWQDRKYDEFHDNLSSVIDDIINSLCVLEDYRNHLEQKIQGLRGR